MLKTKDEALGCFKKFKLLIENGAKQGIRVLRTDRGDEFCSKEFESFCEAHGILRHYTAPYTPQQNGVVERHNRTVVAMAKSLLKERRVPTQYWGEAVKHVVFVLNRVPTRAMSTITPHEACEQPQRFRNLDDKYANTTEIELEEELLLMGVDEPISFEQAITDTVWKEAMDHEINSIEKNNTWQLTDLPKGHKAIDLKWVFKVKKDQHGQVTKHKARLVAKGYVQRQGIDYDEVFAPVTRLETFRLLLALAAKHDWEPKGYVKTGSAHKVYKLLKALYGLRQAPRAWYARLSQYLLKLDFVKCPFEHAVYTRKDGDNSLIVGIYVDNLLVTGTSLSDIVKFKGEMGREFDMSDLGKLSYYLGLEVTQGNGFIELRQTNYAKKMLEKAGMAECNAVKFPMEHKLQLSGDLTGKPVNPTHFKSIVGGLRVLLYGLVYTKGRGNYILSGFSDSDLAGSLDDRKSTGGMASYLDENLITWVSQKQRCIALSSCEAEFMAATATACQEIWLQRVLGHITGNKLGPVTLYINNRSAVDLARNPVFHGRSKHIDLRYHFIRDSVEQGLIVIKNVGTSEQRADILTKALAAVKFKRMRDLLGVRNLGNV
ncbi:hypothetical protein AgCh_015555 [Apium graveolens]